MSAIEKVTRMQQTTIDSHLECLADSQSRVHPRIQSEIYHAKMPTCSNLTPRPASNSTRTRPYLVGTGGGGLELAAIDGPIAKIRITGPAARVNTVRVAVTQKLRDRIPTIGAVQMVD